MTDRVVIVMALAGAWILFVAVLALRVMHHRRIAQRRYELFALRDRLYWLAIDGKVSTDGYAYKMLCSVINGYARYIDRIRWRPSEEITPTDAERVRDRLEPFIDELLDAHPELQIVAVDVFNWIRDTLVENTFILRVYVHVGVPLRSALRILAARFEFTTDEISEYRSAGVVLDSVSSTQLPSDLVGQH